MTALPTPADYLVIVPELSRYDAALRLTYLRSLEDNDENTRDTDAETRAILDCYPSLRQFTSHSAVSEENSAG